jgi:1-deoxy-D-xylulose-5-phosphate synthase
MSDILNRVNSPQDLKKLSYSELEALAAEIREKMIGTVSRNGGHLASSLGVVELTIALHRVFNSPVDKIIWDVGHQCYAHKLLTGRREQFDTIRQYGGLSGFPVIAESPHDAFTTGHAGTSISAALGMALARDLKKEDYRVIAVIGDGSISTGMAFEAINHAGQTGTRLIVILNDNGMSISPSVGAVSRILSRVRFNSRYILAKKEAARAFKYLPLGKPLWNLTRRIKRQFERAILPGTFWEELGFSYMGPLDGHNIRELEVVLSRTRDFSGGPTLIHIITRKGKGYAAAEDNATKFHGVTPEKANSSHALTYSQVLGQTVTKLMRENPRVVAITAAMLDGTGLSAAAAEFPERVFDVGICEQHAVTLAAGMATRGFIPVVAIYSTFLQRAYDQIIHDVCIPNLPVVFAVDRAGIIGDDGATHQGAFDISYLRSIPNMVVSSAKDEEEMQHLLYTAVQSGRPFAIRYPRGNGEGVPLVSEFKQLALGKGEVLRKGDAATIIAFGSAVYPASGAAEILAREGVNCTVINARFVKPLDSGLILDSISTSNRILVVEENTLLGGLGSTILELLANAGLTNVKVECIGLPDRFIGHGSQELFRSMFNLDAAGIIKRFRTAFPELFEKTAAKKTR